MLRKVPPAGAPITFPAILRGIKATYNNKNSFEEFQERIQEFLNVKRCFLVSSGRAALFLILKVLQKRSKRDTVIIPGYTCYTVAASIARAGLKILPFDLSIDTLGFDINRLSKINFDNVLCILPTYLFGLPANIKEIIKIAKDKDVCIIEDAAQAFGGEINGKKLGTLADIGFFSLQRGKNITTMEGGIIVTNSESFAEEISKEISRLPSLNTLGTYAFFLRVLIYWLFLNPSFYWIPDRLPFVKLGITEFKIDFPLRTFSNFQAGLGKIMVDKIDEYNTIRKRNVEYLSKNIPIRQGYVVPSSILYYSPALIRFPVIFSDLTLRDKIFLYLQNHGIGCSNMYPSAINEIPGIIPYLSRSTDSLATSKEIAEGIITFPTHPLVTQRDLELIVNAFKNI